VVRSLEVPPEEATTVGDIELAVGVARIAGAAQDAGGIDVDVIADDDDTSGVCGVDGVSACVAVQ
jgi:hypothetical protein